ncbi:MAG: hypothetical protein PGN25_05605 [Methylorubrum populi]
MPNPLDDITLSLEEAAAAFMLSPRRLQQLTKGGHAPKPERGRYPALPLLHGYLQFMRAEERSATRSADDELKRLRIQRERRKNDVEVRKLLPLEDAEFLISELVGLIRLEFNNVPARFSRELDVRDKLQEKIDDAFHAVANGIEKCGAALRADGGSDPSEAAPDDEDDD